MKTAKEKQDPIVGLLWWKVVLSPDGGIRSCEQVSAVQESGSLVTYVQATRKADACSAAQDWKRRYDERKRAAAKARKQAAEKAGKCNKCRAQPAAPNRKRCVHCIESAKNPAKPDGLTVACEQAQARASSAVVSFRASLLGTVLVQFDAREPADFRAWLVSEIARAS
jgi:hypothetical protein